MMKGKLPDQKQASLFEPNLHQNYESGFSDGHG
jgi:hypothetical protein